MKWSKIKTCIRNTLCVCLKGKRIDVANPVNTSEHTSGFKFIDIKLGRTMRAKHIIPDRPVVEEPSGQGGTISYKRSITVHHNGRLVIEDFGYRAKAAPVHGPYAPKHIVVIDCDRQVTSCKGTHPDVILFFIHGVGGSHDVWGRQLDFFSQLGYEVIALDLVGHGASAAPRNAAAYTFYALADDVRIIFKRYCRKRSILIGHSYGASFCTLLAYEYPEQVHKLVLIGGGGPSRLDPSSMFDMPIWVLRCLSPLLKWIFLRNGFARQGAREKRMMKDSKAFRVSPFVLRAVMSGQYWPEGGVVYHAELTVPTLLLHGAHDRFVAADDACSMDDVLLSSSLRIVEGGGHMVMLECPDAVNKLLHEFFLWEPGAHPFHQGCT